MIGVLTLPDALHLEVQEEAFGHRVIPAVPFAAHAADEAIPGQQILVQLTGILTALIGMDDQAGRWLTLLDGHAQGIANQLGGHAWRHGPADHLARVQVQHDRQIQPAGTGTE